MPEKFNELLLRPDIIELYNSGITPDYGYLMNGRFEKDMIKTLYHLNTLSGNPITWEASDTEYLFPVISLEPKQEGSGDPSPENVRPISGYDSVTVTQSKDEAQVKQITLTLPETIYGGTVDAVTGVGEKTWECTEFDGTEEWLGVSASYGYEISYRLTAIVNVNERKSSICSHFKYAQGKVESFWVDSSGIFIRFATNEFSNVEDWNSYLATQKAAGTPVTVCYKLATPEPFQATGNQPLTSLLGYNTIYTNGDSITLNRKARRLEV